MTSAFCCTVSLAFLNCSLSSSVYFALPSWKFISRCRNLCVQCFRVMGHRIPFVSLLGLFCSKTCGHCRTCVPTTCGSGLSWGGFSCRFDICEPIARQRLAGHSQRNKSVTNSLGRGNTGFIAPLNHMHERLERVGDHQQQRKVSE